MRQRSATLLLTWVVLGATGCGDPTAMVVKIDAHPEVPRDLTAVRVEVHQGETLLQAKTFELAGKQLPQRIRITRGSTYGEIEVRAQGLRREQVEAQGRARGTLSPGRTPLEIAVELLPPPSCTGDGGCSCVPGTCQELGATCGVVDAGCFTTLDCGSCTQPDTCGGGGDPLKCGRGCVPYCIYCGEVQCGRPCLTGSCPAGRYCDAGACACPAGRTECGGQCVDLENDPNNCGSCGKVCPNFKKCSGGLCLCTEPADNEDGHCCPAGMTFSDLRCWGGPRGPATSLAQVYADCATLRVEGGMACPSGVPIGACGYFVDYPGDLGYPTGHVGVYSGSGYYGGGDCYWDCFRDCPYCADAGSCGNCSSAGVCADGGVSCWTMSCKQPYYCSMRPLGPTAKACQGDEECPPGRACDKGSGVCQASSRRSCCTSSDCDGGRCVSSGTPPWRCQ